MGLRYLSVIALILLSLAPAFAAQSPKVEFHPYGETVLCKGCGHWRTNEWSFKVRLTNRSNETLIVYGSRDATDGTFEFVHESQERNPHTCEWRYGDGSSEPRVRWRDRPISQRVPFFLPPGASIERAGGFGEYASSPGIPVRLIAYVATEKGTEPNEIYSTPYIYTFQRGSDNGSYRTIDNTCTPQCTLSAAEAPVINGIKLGMELGDFRRKFGSTRLETEWKYGSEYTFGSLYDAKRDPHWVWVTFLDGKLSKIEPEYLALKGARERPKFWESVSKTLGLREYWEPYRAGWECRDFLIKVLPNDVPKIEIFNRDYLEYQKRYK